jgi:hypothetical protein
LLVAARRPLISDMNARQIVPSAIGQSSAKRKRAPACRAVLIDPASRYPPTLVRMPRLTLMRFFIRPIPCYIGIAEVSMGLLLVVLLLMAIFSVPAWPYSAGWGYYPSGGALLLLLILAIVFYSRPRRTV